MSKRGGRGGRRSAAQSALPASAGKSRSRGRPPTRYTPTRQTPSRATPSSVKSAPRKNKRGRKWVFTSSVANVFRKADWHSDDESVKYDTASDVDSESDLTLTNKESEPDSDEFELNSEVGTSEEKTRILPWLDMSPDEIPPLPLPESSSDVLFEPDELFDAIEVYEVCHTYYRIIQLSPFLFEDFSSAMRMPDQSRLLAEIHIAFIRLFYRDDEENQTTFSVQDTNSAFNITLQLLDAMTYAEVLRQYVESDKRFDQSILPILQENYPFVGTAKRLKVLKWLVDRFMETTTFRQVIKAEGKLGYDDTCRECGKPGDVILCDGCEACYHVECTSLKEVPEGLFLCTVCEAHDESGATNLRASGEEPPKQPVRLSPLGNDRHGRTYWFVARRIFVETGSQSEVYYYSSLPQFYNLVKGMDHEYFEKDLCGAILDQLPNIVREMRASMEMANKLREKVAKNLSGQRDIFPTYLEGFSSYCMADVVVDILERPSAGAECGNYLLEEMRVALGFEGSALVDTFWSGGLSSDDLIRRHNLMVEEQDFPENQRLVTNRRSDVIRRGFRTSFSDGHYRFYVNQYSTNELAKSARQRGKERDKKRYMGVKFSIGEESEFTWACPKTKDIYMNEHYTGRNIQQTLLNFVESIPDELFHRLWRSQKPKFLEEVSKNYAHFAKDANESQPMLQQLRYFILKVECSLRKPVFANVWWNSLGMTKQQRVTYDDRDKRQKLDARKKKDDRILITIDPAECPPDVHFVKYIKGKPLSLWRIRDEGYRLNNRGGMGGWMWMSSSCRRTIVSCPEKVALPLDSSKGESNRKAQRLDSLVTKLNAKAEFAANPTMLASCYSPLCRVGKQTGNCYNSNCKNGKTEIRVSIAGSGGQLRQALGEDRPFPMPEPFDFKSRRSGARNLLVLPQAHLAKLARQGGVHAAPLLHGFHRNAKSNFSVWPYPCPRPLFDHCWRYNTVKAGTLHALALSLKMMHACVRWADMKPPEDTKEQRVVTHYPDHDELRFIVNHKEFPPDGYYERYLLRVYMLALEEDMVQVEEDQSDTYRTGGGIYTRKKEKKKAQRRDLLSAQSLKVRKKGEVERWADGVELKLYEIRSYWHRYNNEHQRPVPRLAPPKPIQPASTQADRLRAALNKTKGEYIARSGSYTLPRVVQRPALNPNNPNHRQFAGLRTAFAAPVVVRQNGVYQRQPPPPAYQSPSTSYTSPAVYATTPRPIRQQQQQQHHVVFERPSHVRVQYQTTNGAGLLQAAPGFSSIVQRTDSPYHQLSATRRPQRVIVATKRAYTDAMRALDAENGKENGKHVLDSPAAQPEPKKIRLVPQSKPSEL